MAELTIQIVRLLEMQVPHLFGAGNQAMARIWTVTEMALGVNK